MSGLQPGDRVKLTDQTAATVMRGLWRSRRHHRVNWPSRRGVVVCASPMIDIVTVQWDDRKTRDHWPFRALEKDQ